MVALDTKPTGHLYVSYLRNLNMTYPENNNFFAHYVFPFVSQKSATISLNTYDSKIMNKPCSLKTVEVKKMKYNAGWFKKGQPSHSKLKFSKKNLKLIMRLYEAGYSRKDVARKFNCSPTAIKRVLNENRIKQRSRSEVTKLSIKNGKLSCNKLQFSAKKINSIRDLYKSGQNKEEISKIFGCSVTPITRILLENNIRLRNRSEIGKISIKKHPIWNKGRKMPELSERFKKYGHPAKGKPAWNKGLKGVTVAWNKGLTIKDPRVKKNIKNLQKAPFTKERRRKISQSVKKLMTEEYKKNISEWTKKGMTEEVKKTISKKKKEWIKNNPELAREYMKSWVNSGTYGFGTYSTAPGGHKCVSSLELWVDEKLIEHGLKHKIHPPIPNSTKFADFLVNDIYIEVDGMSKETEEDWNGKLGVYKKNNLKFIIIKPKDNIDKICEDIKNGKVDGKKNK